MYFVCSFTRVHVFISITMKGKKNSLVAFSSKWVKADRRSRADEVFALPAFPEASPQAVPGCQIEQSGKPSPEASLQVMPGCRIKQSGKPSPEASLQVMPGCQITQSGEPAPEAVTGCQNEQLFKPIVAVESGLDVGHEHMKKDPDQLKQTMLQHEAMFRDQVRELHRLYQVQQLLMSNSQVKIAAQSSAGVPSSNGSAMCSSNSIRSMKNKQEPAGESKDNVAQQQCWKLSAKCEQQQVLLGLKPLPGMMQEVPKDTEELIKPKGCKVVQRMLDLELPAEEYMDVEEEEMPKEVKGSTSNVEYGYIVDRLMYQQCGTAQRDGELNSQTGMKKKAIGSICAQTLEQHEESSRQHSASLASFEASKFSSRMDSSCKEVPGFNLGVSAIKPFFEGHKGSNPESQMEKPQLPDSLHGNTWLTNPEPCERSANHSSDYAHWLFQDVSGLNKMNQDLTKNRNICANGVTRSHAGQVSVSTPQILSFQRLPSTDHTEQGQLQQDRYCTPPHSRFKRDAQNLNPSTYPSLDLQPPAIATHGRAVLAHPVGNSCGAVDRLQPWFHPELSWPPGQQQAMTGCSAMGQERLQVVSQARLVSAPPPLIDHLVKPPFSLNLEHQGNLSGAQKVPNSAITNSEANLAVERVNALAGIELSLGLPTSRGKRTGERNDVILPLRDGFEEAHLRHKGQNIEAYEPVHDCFGPSSDLVTNTTKNTFVQGFSSGVEMRYPDYAKRSRNDESMFDALDAKRAQKTTDDCHFINQLTRLGHDHQLRQGSSNLTEWLLTHNASRENMSMLNFERRQEDHYVYQVREGNVSGGQIADGIVPRLPCGADELGLRCKGHTFENGGVATSQSHEGNKVAASSSSKDSGKVSAGSPLLKSPNTKAFLDHGNAEGSHVYEDEASDISNQAIETLLSLNNVPLHLDNELSANEQIGVRKECLKQLSNSSSQDCEGANICSIPTSRKVSISHSKGPSERERTGKDFCDNERIPSTSSLSGEEIADSEQIMECVLTVGQERVRKNAVFGNDVDSEIERGSVRGSAKSLGKAVVDGKGHELLKAFSWGESARRRRIRRWRNRWSVLPVCREQIHKHN